MTKEIRIQAGELERFAKEVLRKASVREDVASYVAEGLVQTSLRGVDSHGIRLLPHYVRGVQGGRINPDPKYGFKKTSASTGMFDADNTFGHAACMEAAKHAVALAGDAGTGHIAVYNSTHFGAAAYYALEIAKNDMIGMSFTNTDALVKTYGASRPFLGNNPICVAVPCEGEDPFCLDMATSVLTFNKIRQMREDGLEVPSGAGADKDGIETTDPNRITTLLPIGGYKGYGLSMVVEIFCSLLSGMPFGPHIPKMFEAPMSARRTLGQFVSAIRIDCFQDAGAFKKRMAMMVAELRNEPPADRNKPVQVAGDPEKKAAAERSRYGIPLKDTEYNELKKLGTEYGIELDVAVLTTDDRRA
ncbi:MAG: Ldh family oxidoreductase [Candidatus Omnitrophota bacterium]